MLSDPKVRVAYLIPSDAPTEAAGNVEFVQSSSPADELKVEGVRGYKNVRQRYTLSSGLSNSFYMQWAREPLYLPFNCPVNGDLHTVAEAGTDTLKLANFVAELTGLDLGNMILAPENSDWVSFSRVLTPSDLSTSSEPELAAFLSDCDAFRLSLNTTTNEFVAEKWYADQTWTDTYTEPASVGVFRVTGLVSDTTPSPSAHQVLSGDELRVYGAKTESKQDTQANQIMLDMYLRHRPSKMHVEAKFNEPLGLHPALNLALVGDDSKPLDVCKLYAQLELPEDMFFDQYELQEEIKTGPAIELVKLCGETDLEKPSWNAAGGSTALFKLSTNGTYTVPVHLRYDMPSDRLYSHGIMPAPYVFWACKDSEMPEREDAYLDVSERLGIESVFPSENTAFYVLHSEPLEYSVPVIGTSPLESVMWITMASVLLGTFCVVLAIRNKLRQEKKDKTD